MQVDFDKPHDNDEFITVEQGCRIIGGEAKPIHRSTYYRGVRAGLYPAPLHPSPGISRLSKRRCEEARRRIIEGG
jgi:hypothetical protein